MNSMINISSFKSIDTDPGGTPNRFKDYVEEMNLLFQLVCRKSDGTAFTPTDAEKEAMIIQCCWKEIMTWKICFNMLVMF